MINIFKAGGAWVHEGTEYTVKAIDASDYPEFKKDGWKRSLEEATQTKKRASKAKIKKDS
jgi:hypothetical protein